MLPHPPAHQSSHAHAPQRCKLMRCTYQQLPARTDPLPAAWETTWTHAGTHAHHDAPWAHVYWSADHCLTLQRSQAATRTHPNAANTCVALPSNCPHTRIHSPQVGRPPGPTGAPRGYHYAVYHYDGNVVVPATTASPSSAPGQPRARAPTMQTHALHLPATARSRGSTQRLPLVWPYANCNIAQ